MPDRDDDAPAIVLFDGECALCDGSVRWIAERDRRGVFRFAHLGSERARTLLRGEEPAETMVLIAGGRILTRSDAVVGILRRLGLPWSILAAAAILPRGLRDAVYDSVAARRRRWFGGRTACATPTEAMRARLLE